MPGSTAPELDSGLRRVEAIRYVTALREGGSLPGLVEGDDDGTWVLKFRGAGQGPGALVAEVVAGEIAQRIGLPVPELVLVEVAPELGHAEPDPEIQELIAASPGLNLGMDFLPGSLPFALSPDERFDPELAADVVFFDALVTNIDRTPRNPNLLTWHGRTWLIDHGASFYRQHGAVPLAETATTPTPVLRDHVLLPVAGPLSEAGERLTNGIGNAIEPALGLVPDEWLGEVPEARREDFRLFLERRLAGQETFIAELEAADE
jgi:hypothetical protein